MDGLRVESDLLKLGQDLKAAGQDELLKDLLKRLKQAAKPIVPATRAHALSNLPSRGGLNQRVAKAPQRVTARVGNTTATVAVVLNGKRRGSGAVGANVGVVRHPLFGNREHWYETKVPARWFSDTAEQTAQDQAETVEQVMDDVARRAGFR